MKLIIGLGNPGKEYEHTRHNAGFLLVDAYANVEKKTWNIEKKFRSELCTINKNQQKILLVKPQTFMNNSGIAVRALVDFYKLNLTDLVIIHDEKDLPLGIYKIQTNRSSAGHNGVQSIIDHLGTKDFTRVRIGVGPTTKKIDRIEDYVMQKFSKEESKLLKETVEKIVQEIKIVL